MSAPLPMSLCVITRDAGAQLADCLASVSFAGEIVVVDSGSADDTVEIARRFGARVLSQAWLGYGAQKNFAVAAARHDWVLCLDADERLSPELATSIAAVVGPLAVAEAQAAVQVAPQRAEDGARGEAAADSVAASGGGHPGRSGPAAYVCARRNRFLGRWLAHGEGYPDWNVRVFDRRRARWTEDPVHEHVVTDGPVVRLNGDLLHASAESLETYLAKQNRYTSLQAAALMARGEVPSTLRLVLSPLIRFLRFYLLRLGFLDGVPGLVHIAIGCHNSFVKYAKLRALRDARVADAPHAAAAGQRVADAKMIDSGK